MNVCRIIKHVRLVGIVVPQPQSSSSSFRLTNMDVAAKYHNTAYQEEKPFSLILPRNTNSPSIQGIETHRTNNLETRYERLESGMILMKNYLSLADQVEVVKICEEFGTGPGGFYQPGYKNGNKLSLRMMCFGRNWDPQTFYNKRIRSDGSEAPPVSDKLVSLVEDSVQDAQAHLNSKHELPSMYPDICLVNFYSTTGRLGLHQDRDESSYSLRRGLPVVSISIGDTGEFLYGHTRDIHKGDTVLLESGDVLIFGGKSRHIFHRVSKIIPNSAPLPLLQETMLRPGRLCLTFRQY